VREQARALRDMSMGSQATARQIKLISQGNREQATVSTQLLEALKQIRQITDRNARGVKDTRGGTAALRQRAEDLAELLRAAFEGARTNGAGGNGKGGAGKRAGDKSPRRKSRR
jgi:methyl-accepting chemotaxis protein